MNYRITEWQKNTRENIKRKWILMGAPEMLKYLGKIFCRGPNFVGNAPLIWRFFLQPLNYTLRFFLQVPKPKLLPTGFCKFSSVCETKTHVEKPPRFVTSSLVGWHNPRFHKVSFFGSSLPIHAILALRQYRTCAQQPCGGTLWSLCWKMLTGVYYKEMSRIFKIIPMYFVWEKLFSSRVLQQNYPLRVIISECQDSKPKRSSDWFGHFCRWIYQGFVLSFCFKICVSTYPHNSTTWILDGFCTWNMSFLDVSS